ncbi:uncharacterized protein EKO05_0003531 [Ascochyta rabiei]|uniref:uncharacterized protein n=1 Tax=Didymella rabiei TaxID=5454 RepID=UPI00220BBF9F|nr:uncharacterized protein EKO05_0003531 [Ascochyta rabiei]UPX13002.1 hypothetical protein EKO05_0003531 [Ascochyta rabiei]
MGWWVVSFPRMRLRSLKRAMGADQYADSATPTQTQALCGALSGERFPQTLHAMFFCGGPAVQRTRKRRLPLRVLSALLRFGQREETRHGGHHALPSSGCAALLCDESTTSSSFCWRPRYARQAILPVLTRTTAEPRLSCARECSAAPRMVVHFCNTRNQSSHSQSTFRSEPSIRHARPLNGPAPGRIAWFLH